MSELNVVELEVCDDVLHYAELVAEPEWGLLGKKLGKDMGKVRGGGRGHNYSLIWKGFLDWGWVWMWVHIMVAEFVCVWGGVVGRQQLWVTHFWQSCAKHATHGEPC